jgi:hypothetical protein
LFPQLSSLPRYLFLLVKLLAGNTIISTGNIPHSLIVFTSKCTSEVFTLCVARNHNLQKGTIGNQTAGATTTENNTFAVVKTIPSPSSLTTTCYHRPTEPNFSYGHDQLISFVSPEKNNIGFNKCQTCWNPQCLLTTSAGFCLPLPSIQYYPKIFAAIISMTLW